MKINEFGKTKNGEQTHLFTLENSNGMKVKVCDYGATLVSLIVPDKDGKDTDIVLGYDNVEPYQGASAFFGANVGRNANRIKGARCIIDGVEYNLESNDGDNGNNLHSGSNCTALKMWKAIYDENVNDKISFEILSKDMEQGFPGNLTVAITYTLNDDNELMIDYYAVGDEDTIVNMTNHSYFNLGKGGHKCKDILDQEITIYADNYTPVNDILVPTGEIKSVEGTALDFRNGKPVREGLGAYDKDEKTVTEYDHNFVLNGDDVCDVAKAAQFVCKETGRMMEVYTDQPGLQLYTAGGLTTENSKDGINYANFCGACFESQNFPNAINTKGFPNAVLKAGDEYTTTTVFRFSII